jgi:hypothetical protein
LAISAWLRPTPIAAGGADPDPVLDPPLLSDQHFSVDGTLIQAWASMKSFQPKEPAGGGEA